MAGRWPGRGRGLRRGRVGRRPACGPRSRGDAGYTLIELSAVLAVAILLIVAGIGTLRSVRKADISTAAGRMTSAVRYLYDLSVVTNRPYRLVIDLASNAYWGEPADPASGCGGAALLPSEEERRYGEDRPEEEGARGGTAGGASSGSPLAAALSQPEGIAMLLQGASATASRRPADRLPLAGSGGEGATGAKPARERLLERFSLPKGVTFPRVMTGHQDEPTEEGKAEVYFFPSGYVEPAYIYMERDDEIYTIETVPLKGAAVVHREELDPRDLLDES